MTDDEAKQRARELLENIDGCTSATPDARRFCRAQPRGCVCVNAAAAALQQSAEAAAVRSFEIPTPPTPSADQVARLAQARERYRLAGTGGVTAAEKVLLEDIAYLLDLVERLTGERTNG